jgi:hypothetical protein
MADFRYEREMRPIVARWLEGLGYTVVFEYPCLWDAPGICDVVGVRFAERTGRRIPAIDSLVAVELKLDDVAGVLDQCYNNRLAVHESYAAMPTERIERMRPETIRRFTLQSIGLLAVAPSGDVEVVIPPNDRVRRALWRKVRQRAGGNDLQAEGADDDG